MGKTKDSISWFGEKGKDGVNTIKLAGQAITAAICLTAVGVAVGVANHLIGGQE